MQVYTYTLWLVALSLAIALMASFTGLTLSRGARLLPLGQRQLRIVLSALALGGGIWSMHFVGILAMRFDVPIYFDIARTVASALIAILLACLALLIVHFAQPTRAIILVAGAILGLGITAMHYVGMAALQGCSPVFTFAGVLLAGGLSVALGATAMALAFGTARGGNAYSATLVFGAAVSVVHYTAVWQTTFVTSTVTLAAMPMHLADSQITIFVMLAVFVLCGGFMLVGASVLGRSDAGVPQTELPPVEIAPMAPIPPRPQAPPVLAEPVLRLPYERDGRTNLVPIGLVYALHAEGHYTTAYLDHGPVFCPWSISVADERLTPHSGFLRVHRSWIVNLSLVTAYGRSKDQGYCIMAGASGLEKVPVSRNRMAAVQEALGF